MALEAEVIHVVGGTFTELCAPTGDVMNSGGASIEGARAPPLKNVEMKKKKKKKKI